MSTYDERYQKFLLRLRQARDHSGLTQADVARLLGKPQSYVSRSESGERRLDVVETAEIAFLYQVSLEELVPPERKDQPDRAAEERGTDG